MQISIFTLIVMSLLIFWIGLEIGFETGKTKGIKFMQNVYKIIKEIDKE